MNRSTHFVLILLSAVIIFPDFASAQKLEITPFGGYFFAGKMAVREGDLNIKNDANYGVTIDFTIMRDVQVELMFNRTDTRLVLKEYPTGVNRDLFDMSVNYFHIGGIYRAQEIENGYLFTNFSLGATLFSPDDTAYEDDWRFSIALGGGLKYFLSDKIGIRTQIRILMPIYWAGGGLYFGSGGSGVSLGAGTNLVQGDITGGIIFVL